MSTDQAVATGVLGGMLATVVVAAIVIWILVIIARWKIFVKAGEKGWKSIIPIYSDYVQWRIAWKKIGLFWLMLVLLLGGMILGMATGAYTIDSTGNFVATGSSSVMGLIGSICMVAGAIMELIAVYKLFVSFGHGIGWFIGYIFVPNIMLLILGFGSSTYLGPQD